MGLSFEVRAHCSRSATVGMNKTAGVGFASSLVGPLFGGKAHCRSLGVPRIPVEFYGVDELPAAFLTESRTRGPVMCSVAGIRGLLGMTKGRVVVFAQEFANGLGRKAGPSTTLRSGRDDKFAWGPV